MQEYWDRSDGRLEGPVVVIIWFIWNWRNNFVFTDKQPLISEKLESICHFFNRNSLRLRLFFSLNTE